MPRVTRRATARTHPRRDVVRFAGPIDAIRGVDHEGRSRLLVVARPRRGRSSGLHEEQPVLPHPLACCRVLLVAAQRREDAGHGLVGAVEEREHLDAMRRVETDQLEQARREVEPVRPDRRVPRAGVRNARARIPEAVVAAEVRSGAPGRQVGVCGAHRPPGRRRVPARTGRRCASGLRGRMSTRPRKIVPSRSFVPMMSGTRCERPSRKATNGRSGTTSPSTTGAKQNAPAYASGVRI